MLPTQRRLAMYGVPDNLQLERLIGQEFNFIGLGTWQIQFHISGLVAIHVEGRWELRDAADGLVDCAQEPAARDAYRLHRIIDTPIVRFALDAPRSFTLYFESGHSLSIYYDSEQYEAFSIHFNGEPSFYI